MWKAAQGEETAYPQPAGPELTMNAVTLSNHGAVRRPGPTAIVGTPPGLAAAACPQDDCVTLVDLTGNVGFSWLVAVTPDRVAQAGRPWAADCPHQARGRAHAAMQQALDGVSSRFDELCLDDDGQPYLWQVDVSPMVSREGRIVSVLARSRILRDLPDPTFPS